MKHPHSREDLRILSTMRALFFIHAVPTAMVRFSSIEYELVAGYAKDAGYPISTFVRKQALSEKVIILVNISPQNPFTENF